MSLLLAESRLVTLTGPGGIGKTTLAREVLAAHDGEGWFVDLAPLRSPSDVAAAVAGALGLVVTRGEDAEGALLAFLGPREAVILLDNVEHLDGVGRRITAWLEAAPATRFLATSRIPMRVPGERELPIPGLELPASRSPADLEASPSGALFLRVARTLGALEMLDVATAGDLADLLHRLDGMPLAIELAAGRSRILSPGALLRRLDDPAVVSTRDLLEGEEARHTSLDEVLSMSIDLVPAPERAFLRALAVCGGSFDIDLAHALTPDVPAVPALDLLVSSGLVRALGETGGEPRFGLLETVRAHLAPTVPDAERELLLERLARATVRAAGRLDARWATNERDAMAVFFADLDAVALAVEWCLRHDPSLGLQLLVAFDRIAQTGVHLARSVAWCRAMLDAAPADDPNRLAVTGSLLRLLTRYAGPEEALRLEPELLAGADGLPALDRRRLFLQLAHARYALGDGPGLSRNNLLAAAAAPDPDDRAALTLTGLADAAWYEGHDAATSATRHLEAAAAGARIGRLGNQGISLFKAALAFLRTGNVRAAVTQASSSIELCPPGNVRAFAREILALALAEDGRPEEARAALTAAWPEVEREARIDRVEALEAAVAVLAAEGRHAEALTTLALADRDRPSTGWVRDDHVSFLLERWRQRCAKVLGPVPTRLAALAADGLSLEAAMAASLRPAVDGPGRPAARRAHGVPHTLDGLTAREVEVLTLIGEGRTNNEIAERLYISHKTASVHVTNVKGKLGVGSRLEIALRARELGLVREAPTAR
ncbi:MAG TPA: LuxR C-terminal-related transcriptional regulator [Candidatus Limnocylindrales bacterium]|nr:LuxR C-terminal-related transcriptional regulator [Candidatus Limnocylindrales bacterium]